MTLSMAFPFLSLFKLLHLLLLLRVDLLEVRLDKFEFQDHGLDFVRVHIGFHFLYLLFKLLFVVLPLVELPGAKLLVQLIVIVSDEESLLFLE